MPAALDDTSSLYGKIGASDLRQVTRRLYELMDGLPAAAACRAIHPPDMSASEQKLFVFLSGWTGGPQLYQQRHGPPMLRRRHFVAPIGAAERDGWLLCFERAVDEIVSDADARETFKTAVRRMAIHLQNRD
jgi:hemoglobin